MATTTIGKMNEIVAQVATDIGDLMELGDATSNDIVNLQDQINNIDLSAVITNDPSATGTAVAFSVDVINTKLTDLKAEIVGGAPANMDTLGEVATEIDLLNGRVTLLETKMAVLENKYDANGVLKAEFLPPFVTEGMQFKGVWSPVTDGADFPATTEETSGDMYTISAVGTVNTVSGVTSVKSGDTIIGTEDGWVAIANQDLVVSVNGKTGNVVLVGADIGYTASLASGLVASDVKSALDEIGSKFMDLMANLGDLASQKTVVDYLAMRNAAATDGVQPSPVPSV